MFQILYTLTGEVIHGKENGRTVGMPTANIKISDINKLPVFGVYATVVNVDGNHYDGVTNVGQRPSVDQSPEITVETFLLDFKGDLYGKIIQVDFYKFLRDTMKFDSLKDVKRQVMKDCEAAMEFFHDSSKSWRCPKRDFTQI